MLPLLFKIAHSGPNISVFVFIFSPLQDRFPDVWIICFEHYV